jgi:ribosome-binding factor A
MKTPIKFKDEKASSLLAKFAAEYISHESNQDSLITVTRAEIFNRGKRAFIFFTALPQDKEEMALEFMKRRRSDFRKYVMTKKSFGFVPSIDFCIDLGEHNRQRIDELSNESSIENLENKS